MKKFSFLLYILFSFSSAFLSSCKNDDPIKARQNAVDKLYKNGTVKIAIANSFESNQSKMWEGAILAQEMINGSGFLPVRLELVKFDDGGTSISGMTTAYQIASDEEICAVVGHGYSDISLPCSLIYQYYGNPHVQFYLHDSCTHRAKQSAHFQQYAQRQQFWRGDCNTLR